MRVPSRTSRKKSTQASTAPTPAATAPLLPHSSAARPVTATASARFTRSIRPTTVASLLVVFTWLRLLGLRVFCRGLALVRVRDPEDPLDGGADTEEQTEVHDPV